MKENYQCYTSDELEIVAETTGIKLMDEVTGHLKRKPSVPCDQSAFQLDPKNNT